MQEKFFVIKINSILKSIYVFINYWALLDFLANSILLFIIFKPKLQFYSCRKCPHNSHLFSKFQSLKKSLCRLSAELVEIADWRSDIDKNYSLLSPPPPHHNERVLSLDNSKWMLILNRQLFLRRKSLLIHPLTLCLLNGPLWLHLPGRVSVTRSAIAWNLLITYGESLNDPLY